MATTVGDPAYLFFPALALEQYRSAAGAVLPNASSADELLKVFTPMADAADKVTHGRRVQ